MKQEKRRKLITAAVYAALCCTKLDYRSPKKLWAASEQVAMFVEAALDEALAATPGAERTTYLAQMEERLRGKSEY